jgi:hypothetical protein
MSDFKDDASQLMKGQNTKIDVKYRRGAKNTAQIIL